MDGHREQRGIDSGLADIVAVETILSEVDGEAGRLVLRGHRLEDVAGGHSFEWLGGTLWDGFVDGDLSEVSLHRRLGAAWDGSLRPVLAASAATPRHGADRGSADADRQHPGRCA